MNPLFLHMGGCKLGSVLRKFKLGVIEQRQLDRLAQIGHVGFLEQQSRRPLPFGMWCFHKAYENDPDPHIIRPDARILMSALIVAVFVFGSVAMGRHNLQARNIQGVGLLGLQSRKVGHLEIF